VIFIFAPESKCPDVIAYAPEFPAIMADSRATMEGLLDSRATMEGLLDSRATMEGLPSKTLYVALRFFIMDIVPLTTMMPAKSSGTLSS
jgi:hypothetical protein